MRSVIINGMDSGTSPKKPLRIVGHFIRQRRESIGLSQRALGQKFDPPVTTQFISNVERGVTPLPPSHIPVLTEALKISESEIRALLEKEFTAKLAHRLGRDPNALDDGGANLAPSMKDLLVDTSHFEFIEGLYEAYRKASPSTQTAFHTVCESLLQMKPLTGKKKEGPYSGD